MKKRKTKLLFITIKNINIFFFFFFLIFHLIKKRELYDVNKYICVCEYNNKLISNLVYKYI